MPLSALLPLHQGLALTLALPLMLGPLSAGGEATAAITLSDVEARLDVQPRATIYLAKRILTMNSRRASGEAVAVIGERILAVGSLDDLKHAAGDTPFVLDETFKDKVLVPGFIDTHLNPVLAALVLGTEVIATEDWMLADGLRAGARDPASYRARLREADARLTDPTAPLFTWGYRPSFHGPLDRSVLDGINPARPLVVWNRSGQALVLNGAALERYAVTPEFLAKQGPAARSQIDLAAGQFHGQGALAVLPLLAPSIAGAERLARGLATLETYLHAAGVTAIAATGGSGRSGGFGGVGDSPSRRTLAAVLGDSGTPFGTFLIADGKTTVAPNEDDREPPKTIAIEPFSQGAGRVVSLPYQVALFTEDAHEGGALPATGAAAETDGSAASVGFARTFGAHWRAGLQIHVHVTGAEGLDLALDTIERQMRQMPRYDHRTAIVQVGPVSEEQLQTMARLGVVISANPYPLAALPGRPGAAESDGIAVPLGSAKRAGLPITLHSNMPMAPAQPLRLMWSAINRSGLTGRVAGPDQRLSAEDALAAVTINAAYALRLEHEMGSIEPGKLANFTVLESDPLTVPAEQMATLGVWGTVSEGRIQPVPAPALPARTAGLSGLPRLVAGDAH